MGVNSQPIFISGDQDKASQAAFLNENFRRLNDELSIGNFDANQIALGNDTLTDVGSPTAAYSHGVLVDDTGIYAMADGQTATDANVRILTDGSAYFGGELTAATGDIGGFTIGATDLSATDGTNTTTLSSGATALSAGPTGAPTVEIGQDGSLTATSAVITGEITTASGSQLGGQYIANSSVNYNALDIASFASLSAITANMGSITSGTITMDSAGYIRGGQTDFDTGTGVFLGYSGGDYKFSIGGVISALLWDGSSLTIRGKITATAPINLKAYTTATLPVVAADTSPNLPAGYV